MTFSCTLAKNYSGQNVTGWLLSEKLDGVRALWDGKCLKSRNGKTFHCPSWFTESFPSVQLDGELFTSRNCFQKTVGFVKKLYPIAKEWKQITYVVFDSPSIDAPFRIRSELISANVRSSGFIKPLQHLVCLNQKHLFEVYHELLSQGAEGVMIRNPNSSYEYKRTSNLLKLKPNLDDEAIVIGYQEGTGKHKGRLGSLVCKWNEVIFNIGTGFSDEERENPPKIGELITFKYQSLTDSGVPRFPAFLEERR